MLGQLQTFDKIWLSKIALIVKAADEEPEPGCLEGGRQRQQWLWLDAGLETDQVNRVLNHTKTLQSPTPGKVHLQFYCEKKMLTASEYFKGRCPVRDGCSVYSCLGAVSRVGAKVSRVDARLHVPTGVC